MAEPPHRPRRPGSYSDIDPKRTDRVSAERVPPVFPRTTKVPVYKPPPLEPGDSSPPISPPLPPISAPPPISVPTSRAEREAAVYRAELADALATVERLRQEAYDRTRVERDAFAPDSTRTARAVVAFARAILTKGSVVSALALGALAYFKPAAKPEQVDAIVTAQAQKKSEEAKQANAEDSYETKLRTAYECRFDQLAKVAERAGFKLGWGRDVVFEPIQIARDKDGFQVEKPPFFPRKGTECPELPDPPPR